jgi:hypothetical protein
MAQTVKLSPEQKKAKLGLNLVKARAALAAKRAAQPVDVSQQTRPTPPLARDRVAARRYLEHEMKRALERIAALKALLASMGEKP